MTPISEIQLIKIVKLYFFEGKSKSEISNMFNISRFKVARLIKYAIDIGVVSINIKEPININIELSEKIKSKYALENCIVFKGSESDSLKDLGIIGVDTLKEMIKENMVVGFALGKSVSAIADKISDLPFIHVVQAAGSIPNIEFKQNSLDLTHRIARQTNAKAHALYLPMWLDQKEIVKSISNDAAVQEINTFYSKMDILVTGIGDWVTQSSYLYKNLPKQWQKKLINKGVVSDLCTLLINNNGELVQTSFYEHMIGMQANQIKNTKHIVGVAVGKNKKNGVIAVLNGNWLDSLIVDEELGNLLI